MFQDNFVDFIFLKASEMIFALFVTLYNAWVKICICDNNFASITNHSSRLETLDWSPIIFTISVD